MIMIQTMDNENEMYITEITEEGGKFSISETKLLIVLVCLVVFVRGFSLYIQKSLLRVQQPIKKNVTIVVMGDIGRSPRMQYHALSFAQNGWKVDFVGYDGSKPLESISSNPNIKIHYITHPWRISDRSSKLLFILYAPIKIYIQIMKLYWYLIMKINSPDFVLVQNPPSIPILMIVQFICWLRQTNLIIDWHNFGYTVLGLRLGQDNFMVKFAKWYEKLYGGRAHAHLTVTAAMHRELMYNWDVQGTVSTLYDRPPTHFRRLDIEEIHEFLTRVNLEKLVTEQTLDSNFLPPSTTTDSSSSTLLTTKSSSTSSAKYRTDRPILIVSSTSWTVDEDFSILLKAVKIYDQYVENNNQSFPKLLFVITGNGPLKDKYIKDISKMTTKNVKIITTWLIAEDYPLLLGSADLGICLHTSSSGMDLPMKVVDMFGCGLPVLAIGFNCLDELIKHNKNGLIFKNEEQLSQQLIDLFTDYPTNLSKLESMRNHVAEFQKERWDTNWNKVLLPLLNNN
ncbi:hypothetical protein Glove_311g67 [Diversispora epigaea]|uniref:Chitobiosyldiphosphodolichol beta-mannosyltransferase n=1 Tax=Diversispora epigaea TaxID=1348612 RepID=A0A397HX65_9GLOM|nr:hypothetical protein Glove_311g67 [Diversispora epigaea]